MFRRKRSVSQHSQPPATPASQSAQSAASHAFLKSQTSTNSLSAAAAAAALRNRSPTPTNVENVQTKRMVQRTQSTQPPHNPLMGRSPSGRSASASAPLRRKGSSGSMSSRTFRDQSPSRPSTSSGPIHHTPTNVPPIPGVPAQYASRTRHPANLEPSRGASPGPTSPPRSPIRGVNTDRRAAGSPASHTRLNSLTTVPEQERPTSRGSVNFSYPRGSRTISPSPSDGWSANPKAVALREAALAKEPGSQPKSPEKSTGTRPRAAAPTNAEGSNASKQAGAAAGSALYAASQATNAQKSAPRPGPSAARADRVELEPLVTSPSKEAAPAPKPEPKPEPPALPRTPEIPESEPEQESLPETNSPSQAAASRLSSVSPTIDHVEAVPTPRSSPLAAKESKQSREASSPARSARFSQQLLSPTGAGDQIHQPPARSVSPAKSALKTARGSSLSPERKVAISTSHAQAPSEISDGTSVASDEGSRVGSKKKHVKVSFDDEAEIVGVAASPPTSPEDYIPGSPPPGKAKSRMSWLGIGGKKKQSSDLGTGDDDFDEVLKPRPALPSFGSVRGARDGGPAPIPDFSDNESSSSSDDETSAPPVSFSGDHAIGNALPQLKESSQEALVTDDANPVEEPSPVAQHTPSSEAEPAPSQSPTAGQSDKLTTPAIAVEPATPPIGSERKSAEFQPVNRSSMDQYQIPGGFPPSNSNRNSTSRVESSTPPPAGRASFDDMDTEGEAESIYTDAPEDFDGDGFGSINAIVDGRPIPRSVTPSGTEKEARDVTPRPAEKAGEEIAELPGDDARASTPTQEFVNRHLDEPISFPSDQVAQSDPQPPLPAKSKARGTQNGNIQTANPEQRASIAVSGNADSSLQNLRQPRDTSKLAAGQGKPRPVSLGAVASPKSPIEPFPSSLRRQTSNGSDSSSSFKRERTGRPSRSGTHSMRRTMRSSASQSAVHLRERPEPADDYRPMSAGSGAGSGTLRKTLRGPAAPGTQSDRYSFFSTNKKAARTRSGRSPVKSAGESRFIHSDGEEDAHGQIFSSRFADSSDEEAGNDENFRPVRGIPRRRDAHDGDSTDLEDSSEEERRQTRNRQAAAVVSPRKEPARAPVQEKPAGPNMSGMAAVARQRGVTQRDLEEFVMRPPEGRKSGFLSRIGLKKNKNAENRIRKADVESPSRIDTPLERSRLEREQVRSQGIPENPYAHLATQSEPPSSPKQGRKLSKRHTIVGDPWPIRQGRVETPEPLPENTQSASPQAQTHKEQAPAEYAERNGNITVNGTGDAAPNDPESPKATQTRPPVNRHDSLNSDEASIYSRDISDPGPARDVVIAGSGRKKRFPMLRKAFGLRS